LEYILTDDAVAFSARVPLSGEKSNTKNGGEKMENTQKMENVPQHEEKANVHMNITKEQAKYWYSVAKKDLAEGNREGAWNIYRWLSENNAWFHAKLLKTAIRNSA
jgi:hypothetical protein